MEGRNGGGKTGYIGPCPPNGMHHYHFELFALDAMLEIPSTTTGEALREEIRKHLVDHTELIGTYGR